MLTPEAGTAPGSYQITVQLLHPRAGASGVTLIGASSEGRVLDGDRLAIGTIVVPANSE
jgi:hypothetical protein